MESRQVESQAAMEAAKQTVSMLIIDKKKLKIKESGLPKIVYEQTPWYLKWTKVPIVKAKVGPKIMTLMADEKVFASIPLKTEVKAVVSGIYISDIKSVKGGKLVKSIIGDICANIGVTYDSVDVNSIFNIWKKYEADNDDKPVYDDMLQIFLTSSGRRNGFYKYKSVDGKFLRLSFGFKQQGKEAASAGMEPRNFMMYKRAAMEITGMFKTLMAYNKGMSKYGSITDIPICNYYIPNDWTTCLQTRLGYIYDATSKNSKHELKASDLVDDNAKRVLMATIKNYGFERHHISNFLMFMDDKGMVQGGNVRKPFIDNVIRDYFCVKFITDKKTKNLVSLTEYKNTFNVNIADIMDKILENMSKWLETSKYYIHGKVYQEVIKGYKPLKVGNTIILGSWNNILFDKVEGSAPRVELVGRGGKIV